MKKLLLFIFALFLWTGAWAQDVNYCAGDGVSATLIKDNPAENVNVPNVLNDDGVQPSYYNAEGEMNIVVDLLESKTIEGFSITFAGDRWVSEFTLSYSTDGESYTKIDDYSTGRVAQNPETSLSIEFDSQISARYIKYTSKKSKKNVDDGYSETIKNFALLQYGSISIPAIVADSHKLGIYSFDLGNATGYFWADWGSSTSRESIFFHGKQGTRFSNFTYYGSQFQKIDATAYTTLHIDVYSTYTGTLAIFPITGKPEKGIQINVVENSWNSKDLSIDDFTDLDLNMANVYQIKYVDHVDANNSPVSGDGTHTFTIGNVYLYGTPIVDTENPVMSSVTVASTTYNTATLTVKATDNDTERTITYTVKNSNNETVGTGSGLQNVNTTVTISGLAASTSYDAGDFTVIATDRSGNTSEPMNVPAFETAEAPADIPTTLPSDPVHLNSNQIVLPIYGYYGKKDGAWFNAGGGGGTTSVFSELSRDVQKFESVPQPEIIFGPTDVEGYNYIHFDVFSSENSEAALFLYSGGWKGYEIEGGLLGGKWNSIDIPMSYFETICGLTMTGLDHFILVKGVANKTDHEGFIPFSSEAPSTIPTIYIANIYLYKAETVNIADASGLATYVSTSDLNYRAVDGLKAYKANVNVSAGTLEFTEVDNVPSGEGVLLKSENGSGTFIIPYAVVDDWAADDNAFIQGTGGAVATEDGVGGYNYILSKVGGVVGFYYANGRNVATNRAYINTTYGGPDSPELTMVFHDGTEEGSETDGINKVNTLVETGVRYNLAGQRVGNDYKGIVIVNGRKVVIK